MNEQSTYTAPSKLIGRFDPAANAINRRPAVSGSFALASDGITHSFRVWSGIGKNGRMYLRGTHEPEDLKRAIHARHTEVAEADSPPSLDLSPGEMVLFENPATAENEKRPDWYGYARFAEGYARLSAWNRTAALGRKLIAGSVEPFRPGQSNSLSPENIAPG